MIAGICTPGNDQFHCGSTPAFFTMVAYLASQSSVVKPLLEASREEGRHEGRHEGQVEEGRRMVRLVLSSRFPDCGAFPELDSICDIASIEALVPFASTATLPEIVARIRGSVS